MNHILTSTSHFSSFGQGLTIYNLCNPNRDIIIRELVHKDSDMKNNDKVLKSILAERVFEEFSKMPDHKD